MDNLEIEAQREENILFDNTPLYKDSKTILIIGLLFLFLFWSLVYAYTIFLYLTMLIIGTGLIGMLSLYFRSFIFLHIFRALLFVLGFIIVAISIAFGIFIIYICFYFCTKEFGLCGFTIFKCLLVSQIFILPYYSLRSILKMIEYSTQILNNRRRNMLLEN